MLTNSTWALAGVLGFSLLAGRPAGAADQAPPGSTGAAAPKANAAKLGTEKPGTAKAAASKAKKPVKAEATPGAEVTVKGEMTCAKCGLHESDTCQNVLRVKDAAGKETKYYLAANAVSAAEHEKVCGGTARATVTGKVVSDDGGKKVIAASAVKYD